MKFQADSKSLLTALGLVAGLDTIGEPSGAVLAASSGQVVVCGQGDYAAVKITVPAEVEEEGTFLTQALDAAAYAKATRGEMGAVADRDSLELTGKGWGVTLQRCFGSPHLPKVEGKPNLILEVSDLTRALAWANLTVGKEDDGRGEYVFQAVEVTASDRGLEVAATNGRALFYFDGPSSAKATGESASVIPRQAVGTVLKVLARTVDERVWGWVSEDVATFATESSLCVCRVADKDRRFPPWRSLLGRLSDSTILEVDRKGLQEAVRLGLSVPGKESGAAAFRFADNVLRVEARGQNTGGSAAWKDVDEFSGEAFATVLDLRSVSAFCKAARSERVTVKAGGSAVQVGFSDGANLHAVLSPTVTDGALR